MDVIGYSFVVITLRGWECLINSQVSHYIDSKINAGDCLSGGFISVLASFWRACCGEHGLVVASLPFWQSTF
jgi:hypothetical protein